VAIVAGTKCSARRHSTSLGPSDRSVQRILHKDLNFHLYKTVILQDRNDCDNRTRGISEQHLKMMNDGAVIDTILMTHNANLHLPCYVNKQNYCD
jgi:hypothetical protein